MSTTEINEVETSIENVKKTIARWEKLQKLQALPEWKELIEDGYLRDEPARIVGLTGDLAMRMNGPVQMKWLQDMLKGIAAFNQYILFIKQRGIGAQNELEALQETHTELLREDMEATEIQ